MTCGLWHYTVGIWLVGLWLSLVVLQTHCRARYFLMHTVGVGLTLITVGFEHITEVEMNLLISYSCWVDILEWIELQVGFR